MFLDEVSIKVSGGKGGSGCVSWRREKYVSKGGPDGGDGGNGGNVYIRADSNTDTLSLYRSVKHFTAPGGAAGQGQNKHGKNGDDLLLVVPPGTLVKEGARIVADLKENGAEVMIAKGGRGGFGNAHFKSATRQRPDFAENGEPGEGKEIALELQLVADVGIIGYPSAGKSTLISVISSAKPKIGDYPFTTLVPNLGVVTYDDRSFVVCDVPGLIEKASEGKGLGHQFLKHIERCATLLHLLDVSRALNEDSVDTQQLIDDYKTIRKELEAFSDTLAHKHELVVLSKVDLLHDGVDDLVKSLNIAGVPVRATISAATHKGVDNLLATLLPVVLSHREQPMEEVVEDTVLTPHIDDDRMRSYSINVEDDGTIRVTGKRIEQFTVMTDFNSEGGVLRFKDVLRKIGLNNAIRNLRASDDTDVYIGNVQVDSFL